MPWWYDEIGKLRKTSNPKGNGQDLSVWVKVDVMADPYGWAVRWKNAFAGVLQHHPTVGEVYRQLCPRFEFTAAMLGSQLVVRPDGTVIVPADINPEDSVLGTKEMARWFTLDILGHLLYLRVDLVRRQEYETWFQDEGSLVGASSAEEEAAHLFLLAASGPDGDIDAWEQSGGDTFLKRWNWVRDYMVKPYVR